MNEASIKYPKKVAKNIVDQAIIHGMPVPKVVSMYEHAKAGAGDAISGREFPDQASRNATYFTLFRRFFSAGLKKYSSKMPEYSKTEVRQILTRNREKLIEGLTKVENERQSEADRHVSDV